MNKLIYLAGPITGLTYGTACDWRTYVRECLNQRGVRTISPMRGKTYLEGVGELKPGNDYADLHVMSSSRGLTTRDRFDVMRADAVFVNFLGAERVSIGTVGEIFWADAFRKPVVVCMEDEGNVHDHAMINELTGYRVPTIDEGVDVVRWLFADDL